MTVFRSTLGATEFVLAFAVVFIWGTNFAVIKLGIAEFPPLLFAALRFGLAALPWCLFIRRPNIRWRYLAAIGLLLGAGQFGALFIAMRADISAGLASVVIQAQVFFTVILSVWLFGETAHWRNYLGLALGAWGLWVIAQHVDATTTLKGLTLVMLAALAWAGANVVTKAAAREHGPLDALGLMVWASLFATPALIGLALVFEDAAAMRAALSGASLGGWAAVLWQSLGNTLFGFGVWSWLMSRHPAALITPLALLVPVFGMAASWLMLAEPMQPWKLMATALVLAGLTVNLFGLRRRPLRGRLPNPAMPE